MKKILFIVATHGNELAGMHIYNNYPYGRTKDNEWEVIIGNPLAATLNTRYIDEDLNRCGNINPEHDHSVVYEKRRALDIVKKMRNFDVVYDIHTTRAIVDKERPDCVFINSQEQEVLNALKPLKTEHVIWDSNPEYQRNYLTSNHPVGICLEYQKTDTVEYDRMRIENDFLSIIHSTNLNIPKTLWEASYPVTQNEADAYHVDFTDFKELTEQEKLLFEQLNPNASYAPVFVNTREVDPQYYCFLNKKLHTILI